MAQKLTPSDVKGLFEKHSNWGRWGKDDERGASPIKNARPRPVSCKPGRAFRPRSRSQLFPRPTIRPR